MRKYFYTYLVVRMTTIEPASDTPKNFTMRKTNIHRSKSCRARLKFIYKNCTPLYATYVFVLYISMQCSSVESIPCSRQVSEVECSPAQISSGDSNINPSVLSYNEIPKGWIRSNTFINISKSPWSSACNMICTVNLIWSPPLLTHSFAPGFGKPWLYHKQIFELG